MILVKPIRPYKYIGDPNRIFTCFMRHDDCNGRKCPGKIDGKCPFVCCSGSPIKEFSDVLIPEWSDAPITREMRVEWLGKLRELAASDQIRDDYKPALKWAIEELLYAADPGCTCQEKHE